MSDIEPESKSSACQETSKSMGEEAKYQIDKQTRSARKFMEVAFEVYGETAILEAIRSLSNQAPFKSMPGIEEEPAESILGKRKAKEAFESMVAKVPREKELAKSMPGKLPPIEEEPGLGKVPIEGEPAKTMLETTQTSKAAKSMEDGKAKSTEASIYSLHNNALYQYILEDTVEFVKTQRQNAGSFKYKSVTPTADFQSDLDMEAGDFKDLQYFLHPNHNMDFGCLIHPDDLPDLKCCEDVAKYICFNKQAKEATRKAIRSRQNCRKSPAYKALLDEVTDIYREVSGNKEWRFEVTADFQNELGMSSEDVFVFFGEIRHRMPWCSSITDNLFKLRSFQDVADFIVDKEDE